MLPSKKPNAENNLIWAVGIILGMACLCSAYTAWTIRGVLGSLQNSQTMALLITDAGIKSDDANLERQLSSATAALKVSADVAYALVIASLMMAAALAWRVFAGKAKN